MKKFLTICLSVVMLVSSISINTLASGVPSDWALSEVDEAIIGGLVPLVLQDNYQSTISRAEYVLLALEYVEDIGLEIIEEKKYPFSDVFGHEYEDEIVRAFNAGVIGGYPDGTFRPDANISREEIATLMVNLIKVTDVTRNVITTSYPTYSDGSLIGSWAINNINYCYEIGILKGVGRDIRDYDIIDPKGNSTIEQAILLILRLEKAEEIYSESDAQLLSVIVEVNGIKQVSSMADINEFSEAYSSERADVFIDLQKLSYAYMTAIYDDSLELRHDDGSTLTFIDRDTMRRISLTATDADNYVMTSAFRDLLTLEDFAASNVDSIIRTYISDIEDGSYAPIDYIINDHATLNIYKSYLDGTVDEPVHIFECWIEKEEL